MENKLILKIAIYTIAISILLPLTKLSIVNFFLGFIWIKLFSNINIFVLKFILEFLIIFVSYYSAINFMYNGYFNGRKYCGSVYMESIKYKRKFTNYFKFLSNACKILDYLNDNKSVSCIIPIFINWFSFIQPILLTR